MKRVIYAWSTIAIGIAAGTLLTLGSAMGCSGSNQREEVVTDEGDGRAFGVETVFTAYYGQILGNKSDDKVQAAEAGEFKAVQVLRGELMVSSVGDPGDVEVHDWSVSLDDDTWDAASLKTIVLVPGTYDFHLLLTRGNQQYVGSAVNYEIVDGATHDIAMTIRPVIGDVIMDVAIAAELPYFKLQYHPDELAGLSQPQLGVIVDGGDEQVLTLNPATGISDTYLHVSSGSHHIHVNIYDGSVQRGRSIPAQEDVIVAPGQDITLDLVGLYGEMTLDLSEQGGDATLRINIPAEVVEEAGGTDNLLIRLSFVGGKNPLQEAQLVAVPTPQGYGAEITLSDVQYDDVVVSLEFVDITTEPVDVLGSCNASFTLSSQEERIGCSISLIRRAVIGGNIWATVGVNVFTQDGLPVAGAVVSNGVEVLGVTGEGNFGTPGYLKLYMPAGAHELTAHDMVSLAYGQRQLSVTALDVSNVDIFMESDLIACSANGECPAPSFAPIEDCLGFADTCSEVGSQAGDLTEYQCIASGCIPAVSDVIQECRRDSTDGQSCGPDEFGDWGSCDYSGVCDQTATRQREVTSPSCTDESCVSETYFESETCSRNTNGISCGETQYFPYGPCQFTSECDQSGYQTREVRTSICGQGTCNFQAFLEDRACSRNTNGNICESGNGVCQSGSCQSAVATDHNIGPVHCNASGEQNCPVPATVSVSTRSILKAQYLEAGRLCSSIRVEFRLNGVSKGRSDFLGWSLAGHPPPDPSQGQPTETETDVFDLGPVAPGSHTIDVYAQGQPGGCNSGTLGVWSGVLRVWTVPL